MGRFTGWIRAARLAPGVFHGVAIRSCSRLIAAAVLRTYGHQNRNSWPEYFLRNSPAIITFRKHSVALKSSQYFLSSLGSASTAELLRRKSSMNVNRRQTLKTIGVSAAAIAGVPAVSAKGHRCGLNWRKELSSRKPKGGPVVTVIQEVVNDIDSGHNGFWAHDDYRRLIQMWEVGDGEFVAVVQYNGQFEAVGGQNEPGKNADGTLEGDEDGLIHGGYAASLKGELQDDPNWPTHGFVGTFDYEGDVHAGTRPGAVRWDYQYLVPDSVTFEFEWWGWVYRGGDDGTWVNAVDEDCGNIS